jgi:hypothetical protein
LPDVDEGDAAGAGGAVTFEKMARLYDATLRKLKQNAETLDGRASVYGALRPVQQRRSPEMAKDHKV